MTRRTRDIAAGAIGSLIASFLWGLAIWVVDPLIRDFRSPLEPEKPVRIEFDASIPACRSGDLSVYLEDSIKDGVIAAPNGADHTVICDDYLYLGPKRLVWADLAKTYPGCFKYETHLPDKLHLITDSGGVCRTPFVREAGRLIQRESSRNLYVCIGTTGRKEFRPNIFQQPRLPRDCTDEELKQFQFP